MSTLEALVSLENQKSIEADDFLSHLSSPLQQYVQDSITLTSTSSSSSNNISMTERIDTFEISTRSHALSLANNLSNAKEDDTKLTEEAVQDLLSFIRSVIDVLLHISYQYRNKGQVQEGKEIEVEYCPLITSSQFRKLPFLLLEDLVDTLPTQTIMKIWNHGPGVWLPQLLCKTEQSENPDVKLFHQGSQYCVLRLCNKILKNLSVSSSNSQAQFAGTITMTLASVFPLSERSAVNVLGAFNTNSKVEYESLEDWWKTNSSSSGSTTDKNNREGTGGKKDGGSKIASTLNYEFYKTFWELQENFTDPTKLLPKDTAKDKNMWVENMNTFIGNAEMVLGAFEDNKFPNQLVKEHKNRWNKAKKRPIPTSNNNNEAEKDECAMDVDVDIVEKQQNEQNVDTKVSTTTTTTTAIHSSKRHYKYITNSQLLHLQLKDPKVRMNILTQFFIILEYLSQSLLSNTTLHKISIEKINSSLVKLEHRAGELLKLTPPNGEIQYNTLKWVLKEREMVWRQWKKNKCVPKIEKFYQEKDSKSITKPRSGKSKDSSSLESLSNLYSYKIDLKTELPSISSSIVESHTPNIFEFLEDYVEALDPEAGIEAEYHPKNDKLFAWRAMRLLSDTKYIGILGGDKSGHKMINLKNGDFEGLVRKMWKEEKGEDIPGELPIYESSDEEIEEVQKEEEKGKNQEEGEKGEEKDDAELNNGADDSNLKGQTTPQKEEGEDEATSAKKIENDGNNGKRSDSGELKVDEKNVSNEMNGKDSNGQHIPAKNDVKNDVKKDNQEALESDTPKSKQTTRSNDVKVEFTNNSAENKRKREDNAKTPVKDRDVKKVKYEKSQKSKTNEAKEPVHQQKSDTKSSNQISRGAHINKKTNSSTNTQGGKTDSFTNAEGRKTNSSTNAEGGKTHSSTNDEGGKTIFSTNTQGGKTSSSSNTQGGKTNSSTNAEGGKTIFSTNTQGGKTSSSSNTQGGRPLRSQNVATRRVDDRKGNVDREFAPHQRPAQIMRPNQRHDGRHMRQTPPPPQQPLPSEGRHPMGNRRPDRRFSQDNVSNPGRYHQGGRDGGRRGGNQGGNQGGPGGQRPGGSHETTGQQRRRGGRR